MQRMLSEGRVVDWSDVWWGSDQFPWRSSGTFASPRLASPDDSTTLFSNSIKVSDDCKFVLLHQSQKSLTTGWDLRQLRSMPFVREIATLVTLCMLR